MRTLLPVLLGVSMAAACTVGDLGDDGTTGDDSNVGDDSSAGDDTSTPTPRVGVAMTPPSIDSELGTIDNDFTVTVTGSDGFSGPVALAFSGVPVDWNAAFDQSTVTLAQNGIATATLNVRVPSNAVGAAANIQVTATSTAATATLATPGALTIANVYTIHIAAGTAGGAHAFPTPVDMKAGATIRFLNDDTTPHRIHSDGVLPHEDDEMAEGQSYEYVLTATGDATFYCHNHDDGARFMLQVAD